MLSQRCNNFLRVNLVHRALSLSTPQIASIVPKFCYSASAIPSHSTHHHHHRRRHHHHHNGSNSKFTINRSRYALYDVHTASFSSNVISHHEKKEQQQEDDSSSSSSKIGGTEEHIQSTTATTTSTTTTTTAGQDAENVNTSVDKSHSHPHHTKGEEAKEKASAFFGKFKKFFKKYGPLGIIIYFGIYFITLFSIFLLLDSGVINAADVIEWIKKLGLDKWVDMEDINTRRTANFALAWVSVYECII